MTVLNRTVSRAHEIASELEAEAGGLDELEQRLAPADVVIACIEAPEPVITAETVRRLKPRTRCFIDISVPRAIAAEVDKHPGTFVMDIDDLRSLVDAGVDGRRAEIASADEIVVREAHKYLSLQTYASLTPLVTRLKTSFRDVLEDVLAHDAHAAAGGSEVTRACEKLTSRLLGTTLDGLKTSSRWRHNEAELRAAYKRFLEVNP